MFEKYNVILILCMRNKLFIKVECTTTITTTNNNNIGL